MMSIAASTLAEPELIALTPQQIRFVKAYGSGLNGTEAAKKAGYAPKAAGSQACRLLKQTNIKAALEPEKRRIAKRAELDADKVMDRLDQTRRDASADGQHGVAARCIELQGKHIGMFSETHRHEHHVDGEVKLVPLTETVNALLIRTPGQPCLLDYEPGDMSEADANPSANRGLIAGKEAEHE